MLPYRPTAARFVAYSTLTREPVLCGDSPAYLLTLTREIPALGFDNRFVEILDCGADGPDARTVTLRLDEARGLYRTMFRGVGTPGQPGYPALALRDRDEPDTDRDSAGADVATAIEAGLTALVDKAKAARLTVLAATLCGALAAIRAERGEREAHDVQPAA